MFPGEDDLDLGDELRYRDEEEYHPDDNMFEEEETKEAESLTNSQIYRKWFVN